MTFKRELQYVGFWRRCGATLIDALLQLVITAPLTVAIYGRYTSPSGRTFLGFGDVVINYVLPAAAVIAFWVYKGATPGKMAMSARVVDADTGKALTPSAALIRYVGYYVSTIALGVGFLWIAFDRRKQGWHDKMANSVVVRPAQDTEPVRFGGSTETEPSRREPSF